MEAAFPIAPVDFPVFLDKLKWQERVAARTRAISFTNHRSSGAN